VKPEDVIVMAMSTPADERVTRQIQTRNETGEIEALALMEPPRGSFTRRNKETDPLRSRKKGCALEKRDQIIFNIVSMSMSMALPNVRESF
jgi:hypothetical protein